MPHAYILSLSLRNESMRIFIGWYASLYYLRPQRVHGNEASLLSQLIKSERGYTDNTVFIFTPLEHFEDKNLIRSFSPVSSLQFRMLLWICIIIYAHLLFVFLSECEEGCQRCVADLQSGFGTVCLWCKVPRMLLLRDHCVPQCPPKYYRWHGACKSTCKIIFTWHLKHLYE